MSIDSQIDRVTRFWKDRAEPKLVLIMAMTAWALVGCLPEPAKAKPSSTDDEQKHPTPTYAAPINAEVSQAQNPVIIKPEATQIAKPEATATIQQPETTGSGGPYPEAMIKDPRVQEKMKAVQDTFTYYSRSNEKPFAEQSIGKGRVQFIYFVDEKAPTDWSKVDVGFETYGENGENHKYIIPSNIGKAKYDVPTQPTGNYSRDAAFGEVEITAGNRTGARTTKYDGKIVRATGSAANGDLAVWQEVQYNGSKWVWGESSMAKGWKDAITQWQDAKGIGDLPKEWTAFRNGQGELPTAQGAVLEKFTGQWQSWNYLLRVSKTSDGTQIRMMRERTELYVADKNGLLYMPAFANLESDRDLAKANGLVLAAKLPGMAQKWNPDSKMVEYVDASGKVEMTATAINVGKVLGSALTRENYPKSANVQATTFVSNDWLSWVGLEGITGPQITELHKAMILLDEKYPELSFLKGAKTVGLVGAGKGKDNGITAYSSKGVVVIGKNFFDGTGRVAGVILHESGHQIQKGDCDLSWEIGNGTVPEGFLKWTAGQLAEAFKRGEIGTYHLSWWIEAHEHTSFGIDWGYLINHPVKVPTCE